MKQCKYCKEEKELDKFYKSKKTKDGRDPRCKDCEKQHSKLRKRLRGIAEEAGILYDGVPCGVCEKPTTTTISHDKMTATIDYSHKTEKIRGILCMSCNSALGKFNDDINGLLAAVEYLKRDIERRK